MAKGDQQEIPGTPAQDMRRLWETELNATVVRVNDLQKQLREAQRHERELRASLGRLAQ